MHLFLCISKNNSYTVQYEYVRPQIPLLALETLGSIFEHFFQNPRITHHFVSIKNPYQNKISKVKIIRTPFYTFLKRWKIFKVQHQNEWKKIFRTWIDPMWPLLTSIGFFSTLWKEHHFELWVITYNLITFMTWLLSEFAFKWPEVTFFVLLITRKIKKWY